VPVTALPVPDEELASEESGIAELDESELSQDPKEKVAAMEIKIIMCFMIMFIIIKTCPKMYRAGSRQISNSP
jgi:hypothetical protein